MALSRTHLLAETVAKYDRREHPVSPTELAETTGDERKMIQARFEEFESKRLLTQVEDGYRPTITARELLALDIDDEMLLILDVSPEE